MEKVFVLHGYWDTPYTDGTAIVKIAAAIEPVQKALDQIAESKAKEYIEMHGYLEEERGWRYYEVTNGEMYAKFYITEEVVDHEGR